jgi:DNA-binding beta-propeller fold protein YncE
VASLALGCLPPLTPGEAQQSGSLGYDPKTGLLFAAAQDNGELLVVDPRRPAGAQTVARIRTGERPEHLVVRGDDVYVSNRLSRTVTHVRASTREVVRQLAVGAEPASLRLSADGRTLVVANAMSRSVQALDLADGATKWETKVGEEVRAVAVLPDGRIYAAGFKTGTMHVLDAATGAETKAFAVSQPADLGGPLPFDRTAAHAHELVVAPGGRVYVPTQQVTNVELAPVTAGYYALGPAPAIAPGITTVQYVGDEVLVEPPPDLFSSVDPTQYRFPAPVLRPTEPFAGPTAAVVSTDGRWLFVVNQFSRDVRVVSTGRELASVDGTTLGEGAQGVWGRLDVGHGANGVVLTEDNSTLYVHNSFDHSITVIQATNGALTVKRTLSNLAPHTVTSDQQLGRRLFHDANNPDMSNPSAGGVACASCHPGGREDGHTWKFAEGLRNTPSLAGKHLAATRPFHWDGQLADFPAFRHVVTNRMGGTGELPQSDFMRMMAWLDAEPTPDNPARLPEGLTPRQQLGRELFEGKAACAACHAGEVLTDNAFHDVGTRLEMIPVELDGAGVSLTPADRRPATPNTPSLVGIFASGPYLHDGAAKTLRERVVDNPGDRHGVTSGLAPDEVDALVDYLETL